jgi:ABC-type protease/lipase transport system fused ATPase/permease subunit
MKTSIERSTPIYRSGRVLQIAGIFDLPPPQRSAVRWDVDLPIEGRPWNIGLIVGPSGAGKSIIARELFGPALVERFDWPPQRSILDAFPAEMGSRKSARCSPRSD